MGHASDRAGTGASAYRSSDTAALIARGESAGRDAWMLIAAAYDACVVAWSPFAGCDFVDGPAPPRPSKALVRKSLIVLLQLHEADRPTEAAALAESMGAWLRESGSAELRGALLAKWRVVGELSKIRESVPAPIRSAAARGWWRGTHGEAKKVVRAFVSAQPPAKMATAIRALRRDAPTVAAVLEGVASPAEVCAPPPHVRGFVPLVAAVLSLLSLGLYLRGMAPQARGGGMVLEVPADMALFHAARTPHARVLHDDFTQVALDARLAAADIETMAAEHDDDGAEHAAHFLRAAVAAVDCREARVHFADLARQPIDADVALPMAKLRAWLRTACPSR